MCSNLSYLIIIVIDEYKDPLSGKFKRRINFYCAHSTDEVV